MQLRDRIKELRRVPASQLRPNPKNWRTHPETQQNALRGVLAEIGIANAVLARELPDGSLMLIDGHLRAETLGAETVPVLVLDVDEAEADKLLVTLDPLAAMAETDEAQLKKLIANIQTENEAIQEMLDSLNWELPEIAEPEKEIIEDDIPSLPSEPITKPGDLWILGEHRLLCGDSTKSEHVNRLMNNEKVDLCFTSPPYGQQRNYTPEGKEKCKDWQNLMEGVFSILPASDECQVLVNLGLIHRDNEWIAYWDPWLTFMQSTGWRKFALYVWDQGSGLPGDWNGRLGPSFELVFHFNRKSSRPNKWVATKPESRAAKGKGGRIGFRKDGGTAEVYSPDKLGQDYKIPDSVIRVNRSSIDGRLHPATFPVALPSFVINCWGSVLYEPFCGSGSTLIAAEQLGRKCYAMEISPLYCDVIVKRWETFTGQKAVLKNA